MARTLDVSDLHYDFDSICKMNNQNASSVRVMLEYLYICNFFNLQTEVQDLKYLQSLVDSYGE